MFATQVHFEINDFIFKIRIKQRTVHKDMHNGLWQL